MTDRSTAVVQSAACLALALCTVVSGCASSSSPISLTQWSWGRNLDLSKNKNRPPSFEADEEKEGGDADSAKSSAPKSDSKEPRRLFGFGSNKKSEEDFNSNDSAHDRSVVPQIQRSRVEDRHWYDPVMPKPRVKTPQEEEAERRAQQAQYDKAEQFYQDQKYAEASKLLKPLTKKKKSFLERIRFWSADPEYHEDHNRVREDSMFLLAESYFKEERFSDAKGYYELLLKEYPSTRHLNVATRRLFALSRTWLGFPEFATSSEVTTVNLENPRATPLPKKQKPPHSAPLVPNFFDKSRPLFDTPGEALDALKAIWMYDPRGPLADDAIMMTATHYVRVGNYQEADRYFSMLREEYPNSPHLQTSFVLGSHVKLMSYQGAAYDVKQLEDARQLKESTLRLFPNLPEKERLKVELSKIEEARAQRLWELVELYGRKRMPKAQIIYAEELLQTYPKSSYAPKAQDILTKLRAPVSDQPSIGARVLNSLPRLRKPTEGDTGAEDFDTTGSSRVDDPPEPPNKTTPKPNDARPEKKRPSASDDENDLELIRNSR